MINRDTTLIGWGKKKLSINESNESTILAGEPKTQMGTDWVPQEADGPSTGLVGTLRTWLRSALPVRRRAWLIVSMLRSPGVRFCVPLPWLPNGLRVGLISTPFTLPGLLVGGLVPGPWLETGDRTGEGERFRPDGGKDVRPAIWMLSREPASPGPPACSD